MANKKHAESFELPDSDAIPDEGNALSSEMLGKISFDADAMDEERRSLSMPRGDYMKPDEVWKHTVETREGDCSESDINPEGRTMLRLSGRVEKGETVGWVFINMSPDFRPRLKRDDDGNPIPLEEGEPIKPDFYRKIFLDAVETYEQTVQEGVGTAENLLTFLEEESYYISVSLGRDGGNFVTGLKPLKRKSRR